MGRATKVAASVVMTRVFPPGARAICGFDKCPTERTISGRTAMHPLARFLVITATTAGAAALVLLFVGRPVQVTIRPLSATPPPTGSPASASTEPVAPAVISETPEANAPAPPPLEVSRNMPAWEQQLAAIAGDPPKRDAATARAIFALLPALPEEALAAAAERAVDALPDADYTAVALPVVANPSTHGLAMSVLFADLMERPDAVALPALLQIARRPAHAFAPTARENLELLMKRDYGNDWSLWEAEIQRALPAASR